MKKLLMAGALTVTSLVAVCNSSLAATDSEIEAFENRYAAINGGVALLDNVRSALISSYVKNNAWPTNPNTLVNAGFVSSINAAWGTPVAGLVSGTGNSYIMSLATPSADIAQGIASRIGGVVAGTSVQITIPIPALATVNQNSLSRVAVAGHPEVNKMFADIDMNSHDLNNVDELNAVLIKGTTATLGGVTITDSLDVTPDATFRRNVDVIGKVKSASVETDTIKVNGGAVIADDIDVGGSAHITKDLTAQSVTTTGDIVAGKAVRAASVIVNGGITAETGELTSAVVGALSTTSSFVSNGSATFMKDALFKGNVTIDQALSVGGIASAMDIREGGMLLRDKYSQLAADNTFSGSNTFNGALKANKGINVNGGGVFVNGKRVVSDDGSTLYENGVALSSKYLSTTGTAYDSDRLGGAAASSYARTDVAETFSQNVTFKKAINIEGSNALMFSTYGGGWYMSDPSWIRAAGSKGIYTPSVMRADGGFVANGKQVVSADGNVLYEGGAALSTKYLGKKEKAVSAVNADNATKLGGAAAASYARRDTGNTFSGTNTFNGGANFNSSVTFGSSVAFNNTVSFKDSKGNTKTLSALSSKVDELDDWKVACQRDATSVECGLALNNRGGGTFGEGTVLYNNNEGLDRGNFTLSQPYTNFGAITVYGSNDSRKQATVRTWTKEQIQYFASLNIPITIWHNDDEFWFGSFDSSGRTFITGDENSRVYRVVGYK